MNEMFEPTKSQIVASIISRTGKSTTSSLAKSISYRVPVTTLARVDAMADQAGKSRNQMLNLLLDVALDQVGGDLSQAVFEEVQSREIGAIRGFLDGATETMTE